MSRGPSSSGTVTIADAQVHETDGAPDRLHSLLFSYLFNWTTGHVVRGCVRYIEGDAGP